MTALVPEAFEGAREQRFGRKRGQRRFLGWLPDEAVAADQGQRCIPRPHRDREIECRDDPGDAERMPRLHHPVLATLGCDGQAIELTRQAHREVADVDHLLDFAESLRRDLADFDRNELAEGLLVGSQFFAKKPDEFAALGGRNQTPFEEGGMSLVDRSLRLLCADLVHMGGDLACDWRTCRKRAADIAASRYAELAQERVHLACQGLDGARWGVGRDGHDKVSWDGWILISGCAAAPIRPLSSVWHAANLVCSLLARANPFRTARKASFRLEPRHQGRPRMQPGASVQRSSAARRSRGSTGRFPPR